MITCKICARARHPRGQGARRATVCGAPPAGRLRALLRRPTTVHALLAAHLLPARYCSLGAGQHAACAQHSHPSRRPPSAGPCAHSREWSRRPQPPVRRSASFAPAVCEAVVPAAERWSTCAHQGAAMPPAAARAPVSAIRPRGPRSRSRLPPAGCAPAPATGARLLAAFRGPT
ncbi:hypothetical protein BS78_04G076400 [Paspalum vaginatum]|nr:hypothetical protein BS78_04G076400 [Paspalum vaginatum]